jgi:hypothetical protein
MARQNSEALMLNLAKGIVLREQEVANREVDVARRRQELAAREHALMTSRRALEQLRLDFSAAARGESVLGSAQAHVAQPAEEHQASGQRRPSLARTQATIAQRVMVLLEMEPRALSPIEIFNLLELKPPIATLRATLWKMAEHSVIARPYQGHYCARQYAAQFQAGESTG